MKLKIGLLFPAFTAVLFIFFACTKNESSSNSARLQVYLTDDPGPYQAVLIDVQDVRVNYSNDTDDGWESLPGVAKGTYDLLTLVNDNEVLLADAELKTGTVEQIRLILGPENYVRVGGVNYKLETPSAQQSGLKIKLHQELTEGLAYKLLLDFDVAKSIHKTGNGKYMLKPVIRAVAEAVGGSIKGTVLPATEPTAVLAIQGADTTASTYTMNGAYLIKGINAGTYDLHFIPNNSALTKQIKTGITVTNNTVTTVAPVQF
jgi:hypothetical protein